MPPRSPTNAVRRRSRNARAPAWSARSTRPRSTTARPDTNYGNFSYAGTVWHVFENNCTLSTTITDPNSVIDTWAGNELFNVGKNIVGATNSLHYAMLSQDSMLKPLDSAVENAAQTFYGNVYVRWFAPVALIMAIILFRYVWSGDLASISKRSMWAIAGMWLAASVLALGPVYSEVDSVLLQKTSEIQAGFLPDDQVDAQRNVLPDSLVRQRGLLELATRRIR